MLKSIRRIASTPQWNRAKRRAFLWQKPFLVGLNSYFFIDFLPDESFNLGFFKQNGRFDKSLLIF
ncbi:MAG: hypothetical protein ACI4M6_04810 [Christensenellaceae bacterium]